MKRTFVAVAAHAAGLSPVALALARPTRVARPRDVLCALCRARLGAIVGHPAGNSSRREAELPGCAISVS